MKYPNFLANSLVLEQCHWYFSLPLDMILHQFHLLSLESDQFKVGGYISQPKKTAGKIIVLCIS
jgi:hypothetical protein